MSRPAGENKPIHVVLADANVLYSRVLRHFLLYAAEQAIITIAWSPEILREATEHLKANVVGFDDATARRLVSAMNDAYPLAEVEPSEAAFARLAEVTLPDEDDRHVLAAAIADVVGDLGTTQGRAPQTAGLMAALLGIG